MKSVTATVGVPIRSTTGARLSKKRRNVSPTATIHVMPVLRLAHNSVDAQQQRFAQRRQAEKANAEVTNVKCSYFPVLIASALLLCAASPSPQPRPAPSPRPAAERQAEQPKAANANAQANPKPSEPSLTSTQIVPSPKFENKIGNEREKSNYENRQYRLNVLQTGFNAVLATFTLFLVLIGAYQGYQLRRTVDATKEAADASKQSADIALESNKQNREMAQRELRAYVHVSASIVLNVTDPGARTVSVTIRNYGNTPAYDVKTWLGVGVREFPLSSVLGDAPATLRQSSDILGPDRTSVNEVPVPNLNPWQEMQLQNGNGAIYGFGRITYKDVFDIERFTNFRLLCRGAGLPTGRMTADEEGNKAT